LRCLEAFESSAPRRQGYLLPTLTLLEHGGNNTVRSLQCARAILFLGQPNRAAGRLRGIDSAGAKH